MPEYYFDADTARHAMATEGMFNLLHSSSGNKIDFMIARSDEWGRHQVYNRQRIQLFRGFSAYVASAEDIIIGKLMYYKEGQSEKHLRDIAGIVRAKRSKLDESYLDRWMREFGLADIWELVLERVNTPDK